MAEKKKKEMTGAEFVFVLITIPFVLWGIHACNNYEPPKAKPSPSGAWSYSQELVKQYLKSPSTADFGSSLEQNSDRCVKDKGDGVYKVEGWVDSQNGFGATLRRHFKVTVMHSESGGYTVLSGPTFSRY